MRRNFVGGLCLTVALGTAGCQDQKTEPTGPSVGIDAPSLTLGRVTLERGRIKLPSGRLTDGHFGEAARRAIDPDDYVCPGSTPVIDWYVAKFEEFETQEPEIFDVLYNFVWADFLPTYEALYLLTDDTPQVFGYNGQYTRIMEKTHRDTKRFWNIRSDDIQLLAMKGSMLFDTERVVAAYMHPEVPPFFGLNEADARFVAGLIEENLSASQTLDGGNHPLFSFNAFALSAPELGLPDKIIMGDGILAGYEVVRLQDVAPQAIYAHEFAHHIQFENGYFEDDVPGATTQAELTRYTELMADAMSAYYLTHKRGATMNKKRVEQFLEVFFQIGDCGFTSDGHHGTPNQRMAAARFGFDVADQAQKNGHILTSDQFHDRFVAAYQGLVAPDVT